MRWRSYGADARMRISQVTNVTVGSPFDQLLDELVGTGQRAECGPERAVGSLLGHSVAL